MVAGSFALAKSFLNMIFQNWLVAGIFCSSNGPGYFEIWMVAGSFCSGTFFSSKINVFFKNWTVAGSCC
jgi:hypothetical protein